MNYEHAIRQVKIERDSAEGELSKTRMALASLERDLIAARTELRDALDEITEAHEELAKWRGAYGLRSLDRHGDAI